MSKPAKPEATLGTLRVNIPGVLSRAGTMEAAITLAIAMFPGLPITMAAFLLLLQAAAAAQTAAATRAKGLASVRDTKVDDLWDAMHTRIRCADPVVARLSLHPHVARHDGDGDEMGRQGVGVAGERPDRAGVLRGQGVQTGRSTVLVESTW
jgi:hypothetical protein